MRVLHHYQLSASARFIRLVLAERGLVFLPKIETRSVMMRFCR